MQNNFAARAIKFNQKLKLKVALPTGIEAMNPFVNNSEALAISSAFYNKFYADNQPRKLILGINPGRLGAGVTGIPFTDTKRLGEVLDMSFTNLSTHEPSSVFVYKMIACYGGVAKFYQDFYINSVFPLGLLKHIANGKKVNFNYYDSKKIIELVEPQIIATLQQYVAMGIDTSVCICLGNNKNFKYLSSLNSRLNIFDKVLGVEHPRYIIQYKSKQLQEYINRYLAVLRTA